MLFLLGYQKPSMALFKDQSVIKDFRAALQKRITNGRSISASRLYQVMLILQKILTFVCYTEGNTLPESFYHVAGMHAWVGALELITTP